MKSHTLQQNNAVRKQLASFRKILTDNADQERAVYEKKYLKSPDKFFGVSLPFTDKMAKEFKRANKDAGRDYVMNWQKCFGALSTMTKSGLASGYCNSIPNTSISPSCPCLKECSRSPQDGILWMTYLSTLSAM